MKLKCQKKQTIALIHMSGDFVEGDVTPHISNPCINLNDKCKSFLFLF